MYAALFFVLGFVARHKTEGTPGALQCSCTSPCAMCAWQNEALVNVGSAALLLQANKSKAPLRVVRTVLLPPAWADTICSAVMRSSTNGGPAPPAARKPQLLYRRLYVYLGLYRVGKAGGWKQVRVLTWLSSRPPPVWMMIKPDGAALLPTWYV
jgi:hypothetical protein